MMALFNPIEYRTRFTDHCQAISDLLPTPLDPRLVATYDSQVVHYAALERVSPKNRVKLETHIKLWMDWELALCQSKH